MNRFAKKKIVLFSVLLGGLLVLPLTCYATGPETINSAAIEFYGKLVD